MPTKNSSSLGRGSRRSRGKNYKQHKRSKTTPKSSTLTQVPAEEQGLRRILGSGKVVHMETEWWKDSCRHFLSLVMSYKLQFSLQHISENPQSADPGFLLTDGNIWTGKYHLFYKIIPQMQEKNKKQYFGENDAKKQARTKHSNSIFALWFLTHNKHCPTSSHCDTGHKTEKFSYPWSIFHQHKQRHPST